MQCKHSGKYACINASRMMGCLQEDSVEKQLSKSKGGIARAESLSPLQRTEIAKNAAAKRWENQKLPRAAYSGELSIGEISLPCYVLEDGRRVVSGRGLTSAIGMKGRGQGATRISQHKLIKHSNSDDLSMAIDNPIKFIGVGQTDGYEATVLQEICEAILSARDKGLVVSEADRRYVIQADILMRGFARVGLIALIDEATGYQRERAKDALSKILEAFVAKELQPWVKTFPSEYYEQLFRLRGLDYPTHSVKKPQYFGHITNDVVYKRLAPGVLEELKKEAKKHEETGKNAGRLHQRLTPTVGHPKLREYLSSVTTIMKLSNSYADFKSKLDSIHPSYGETISMQLDDISESDF